MLKSKHKDLPHYIPLVAIFIAGIVGFYIFSYDRTFQLAVVFSLSLSYVSWGIIHHTIHGDICFTIILEYLAISLLGAVILCTMLFRV